MRTKTTLVVFPVWRIKRYADEQGRVWEVMSDGWHQLVGMARNVR